MSVKEKEKKHYSVDEQKGDEHQIILYNDDDEEKTFWESRDFKF